MQIAALGSLCLHAAILSLPLGGAQGERGVSFSPAGRAIRATLRPLAAEAAFAAEPLERVAETRAQAASEGAPGKDSARSTTSEAPRQAAGVVAIPASYLDPSQLTELPHPLEEPPLDLLLPLLARPGVARLILYIDESGRVASVDVESATLPPNVAQSAAQIFAGVRFSPGRIGISAVKSRVRITVGAEERTPGG